MKNLKFISLFCSFILILSLSGCYSPDNSQPNAATFACNSENIYFSNETDNNVLKLSIDARSMEKAQVLFEGQKIDSMHGDYMFTIKGDKLCCYLITSEPALKFEMEKPDKYAILDDSFYYIKNGILYMSDFQNQHQTKLSDTKYKDMKSESGRLWLITNSNELVRLSDTQISDTLLADIDSVDKFTVINKTIYFIANSKQNNTFEICSIDFDTMQTDVLMSEIKNIYSLLAVNKYVYAIINNSDTDTENTLICYDSSADNTQGFITVASGFSSRKIKGYDKLLNQAPVVSYGSGIMAIGQNTRWQAQGECIDMQFYSDKAVFMQKNSDQNYYFEVLDLSNAHTIITP